MIELSIPNKQKAYRIKPEYLDKWGPDAYPDTLVTWNDIEMIARGWDMKPEELLDQLIEEE